MKVIDFHLHVGTRSHWTPWVMEFFRQNSPFYHENFSEEITTEGVLAFLDSQGVDEAVVLSEYAPKTTGVVTNEFTAGFCASTNRLVPFGSICLYEGGPPEAQAERAIRELGIRGFKMLPTYAHFSPDDRALFPFYDYCQSAGAPLMFHTGTSIFKGSLVKYGDPLLLDEVADNFPKLRLILEHGGRPFWYDRAAWLITRHENVSIGTAGIPIRQLAKHFPNLERYPDRFIFGSDWPGMADIKGLVEKILELPISDDLKEMILWSNARAVLGG